MVIDLALLRILKYKEQFVKVERYIPNSSIDKRTKAVVSDIRKYFEMNPEEVKLDFPAFRSMFFTSWHKGMAEEQCEFYNTLLSRMEEDVPDTVKKNIINSLLELEFATDAANVLDEYEQGEEIAVVEAISNLVNKAKEVLERTVNFEFADIDDNTIGEQDDNVGLDWCIPVMNEHYRKILGGDQYIVAGRPGKGKTTFLTHNNWSMAQQMPKEKVIVWFNNESRKQRIMSRQIQSALFKTDDELKTLQNQGKLKDEYVKVMGRPDRVQVYDIHGKSNYHLEEILDSVGIGKVGAIVIDMLDNVKFPTRGDLREDQRLEQMYQWSRELGVKFNCPVFPTSQISNEGAGLLFPSEQMLKDSKTGKQGACDGIIMIGASDDPLKQRVRGISMPKTKSKRAGASHMREEVLLDEDKGRYL